MDSFRIQEASVIAMAEGARARGDLREAARLYAQAIQANPSNARARRAFALLMSMVGDPLQAVEQMRVALESNPNDAIWQFDLGQLLERAGFLEEALEALRRAEALDPNQAVFPGQMARLLRRLRDNAGARAAAERALRLDPNQDLALLALAQECVKDGELDEAEGYVRRVIETVKSPGVQGTAWHELGRVLERRERWGEAFDAHMRGNRIKLDSPRGRHALAANPDFFQRYLGEGDAGMYRSWGSRAYDDGIPGPVILTGFPRSGTTMTEQILAAHPGLATCEERGLCVPVHREIDRLAAGAMGMTSYLQLVDGLPEAEVLRFRRMYRDELEAGVEEGKRSRTLIDKHPQRVRDLGLVNRLFPDARVVFMVRDPRDVCLSALFQDLAINAVMVHFLSLQLAAEWYTKIMEFWFELRQVMTLDVLEVRYEDLVTDFDTWGPRLVEFTGMEWDECVREFHKGAGSRVVKSQTFEAVTERMHTRAVGRWKHYAEKLSPILPALEPYVEAFGYEPSAGAMGDG